MDAGARAFYELKVKLTLLEKKGNAFQDWFASLMERRFPAGDFVRVRPWGSLGDRKNDGYIKSIKTLCQVYAPDQIEVARTLAKINEDFDGALPYWQQHFDTWAFVHNAPNGLPPDVLELLLRKETKHKPIRVLVWGPAALRDHVFQLPDQDVAHLFGPAPTRRDFANLGMKDLKPVLLKIAAQDSACDAEVRPVAPHKIEANGLSDNVAMLLKAGMPKADLVQRFFDSYHDVTLGDRIAKSFKARYLELKATDCGPDKIFAGLVEFAGGWDHGDAGHEAAVLAVIAFLFEQCDIFERPPEARTGP